MSKNQFQFGLSLFFALACICSIGLQMNNRIAGNKLTYVLYGVTILANVVNMKANLKEEN